MGTAIQKIGESTNLNEKDIEVYIELINLREPTLEKLHLLKERLSSNTSEVYFQIIRIMSFLFEKRITGKLDLDELNLLHRKCMEYDLSLPTFVKIEKRIITLAEKKLGRIDKYEELKNLYRSILILFLSKEKFFLKKKLFNKMISLVNTFEESLEVYNYYAKENEETKIKSFKKLISLASDFDQLEKIYFMTETRSYLRMLVLVKFDKFILNTIYISIDIQKLKEIYKKCLHEGESRNFVYEKICSLQLKSLGKDEYSEIELIEIRNNISKSSELSFELFKKIIFS